MRAGNDTRSGPTGLRGDARVAGITLTHPERVLFPSQGLTKLALARYYEDIADWILPPLRRRPLSLLRCPRGSDETCFFQKHPGHAVVRDTPAILIREKYGAAPYVYVERLADLIGLVQIGALELHPWGCRIDDLERPDTLVLDLDPGPGVAWQSVLDAARSLQDRLADYLRNARGVTAIAPYSTRAREGAPVAVPVRRDELVASLTSHRYDVDSVRRRLAALRSDPWEGYEQARRPLTRKLLRAAGADEAAR